MKNLTNKILVTVTLITVIAVMTYGQTTVSGGIYSNTTWTLANSPYTADTVVVFPNVTLTIEPGVVVFVNGNLEIRQATLIAEGTSTDSITFIGSLPIVGDTLSNMTVHLYQAHTSRLNYCTIKDNPNRGLEAVLFSSADTIFIKNSYFSNNGTGLNRSEGVFIDSCVFKNNAIASDQSYGTFTNCIFRQNDNALQWVSDAHIQNCIIDSNAAVGIESDGGSTIANCQIKNNGTGINCHYGGNNSSLIHNNTIEDNGIGISLSDPNGSPDSIYCNRICNNSNYNIKMTTPFNRSVAYNYWCTTDSLTIANSIYDGYDNATLGLLNFMPIDTLQCYSVTGVPINEYNNFSVTIFPNPASDYLIVRLPPNLNTSEMKIFNLLGEIKSSLRLPNHETEVDVSNLAVGVYFLEVSNGKNISRQKFVRQQNSR